MAKKVQIFFVYKFRLKKAGLFYIGITNNMDARKGQHCSSIYRSSKKRKAVRSVYLRVVKSMKELHTNIDFTLIKKVVIFNVLDIKDTLQEAMDMEAALINKYKNHSKFLNIKMYENKCHFSNSNR